MRWGLLASLLAACGFTHGAAAGSGGPADATDSPGPGSDAHDAPVDVPPGVVCFGTGFLQVCETAVPPATLDTSQPLDTSGTCDTNITVNASGLCVKIAHKIDLSADWHVSGSKPLVLVAEDSITISALLDAASHHAGPVNGPGAGTGTCGTNNTPTGNEGGPGGSFGGTGGPGSGTVTAVSALPRPTSLRGGCKGTNGGGSPGSGGAGGGAVYLIAGNSIMVTLGGAIDASGAGGLPGPNNNGGGGGGSGGLIVLDGATVSNFGNIFASGGGGGQGGDSGGGAPGGEAADASNAASGGANSGHGGHGGIGSFGSTKAGGAGGTGNSGAGDGGGGGSAGYLLVFRAGVILGTGALAPPPS